MFSGIEAEPHVTWQPSLLSTADPDFDPTLARAQRRSLGRGAWVDLVPGWVSEPDALFEQVLVRAPWKAFERPMYDRVVEVPRLETRTWHDRPALIDRMARCLGRRYGVRLPALSANLYRDGRDSVAWHGDRIGRHRADAVVVILSLGATRTLLLRPDGGGPSTAFPLHSGDLLVQGGTCQRTFEHCVPKRAHAGPRISVMFRQQGGN